MSVVITMRELSYKEKQKLIQGGGYRSMAELNPNNVSIGQSLEILNSYGEVVNWTLLYFRDTEFKILPNLKEAVARKESGEHRGMEFVLDSSMSDCYDQGWRII